MTPGHRPREAFPPASLDTSHTLLPLFASLLFLLRMFFGSHQSCVFKDELSCRLLHKTCPGCFLRVLGDGRKQPLP